MSKFIFHHKRANTVLLPALEAYEEERFLYKKWHANNGVAPQQVSIPCNIQKSSVEHQVFLFFTTLITLQSVSDIGFRSCVEMYEGQGDIFSYEVLSMSIEDIATILKKYGINKPEQWAKYWYASAIFLFKELQGQPLNLFNLFQTIDDYMVLKKRGELYLPGYGPKLMSLLTLFYEELALIATIPDAIPVDVHHQRICITTGIVTMRNPKEYSVNATLLAEFLRKNLAGWYIKMGNTPLNASHSLFFLGSKACSRCERLRGLELYCPIADHCSGGIPTRPYWKTGKWDLSLERKRKGHCQKILNLGDLP